MTTLGRDRLIDSLLPEDIQKLRADLISTRAVSTVNHYLATFAGFLYWCENNHYCGELGKHCVRFTKSSKDPDPLTHEEYLTLIERGCQHPIDEAAVTVAVYTGLRRRNACIGCRGCCDRFQQDHSAPLDHAILDVQGTQNKKRTHRAAATASTCSTEGAGV